MILIAGPCVVENKETLKQSVETLLESTKDLNIDFIFKSSFRKDNRTNYDGFSGIGVYEALNLLKEIKQEYNVKICSDIHTPDQLLLDDITTTIDVIQIPAFLAKQQTLVHQAVVHCILYKKQLHIKKPQFIGPNDIKSIVDNVKEWGIKNPIITDRGIMFGYDKVIMDPRHINIMKENNVPVLWDITHPNKNWNGDKNEYIETLGKTALINGVDGIFMETHPDCNKALCDGSTMLDLKYLKNTINKFYNIWEFNKENN